ncbi:MAG: M15 family metallopeptidase [Polyangiaceae bacterium]
MPVPFTKYFRIAGILVGTSVLGSCASPKSAEVQPGIGSWAVEVARQSKRGRASSAPFAGTVAQALSRGCSTLIVGGLSQQIIAESNCLDPDTYVRVPSLPNMTFGNAVFPYLKRGAHDALIAAVRRAPRTIMRVNSMLRTVAQQYLLYAWHREARCGISLAALPGRSNHESGEALDVSRPERWRKRLGRQGFRWLGPRDRWHFDYVRGDRSGSDRHVDIEAFQRLYNRNRPERPIAVDGDFGPATERALREAPAAGYPVGAVCGGS